MPSRATPDLQKKSIFGKCSRIVNMQRNLKHHVEEPRGNYKIKN